MRQIRAALQALSSTLNLVDPRKFCRRRFHGDNAYGDEICSRL
jgi:hypothetical protein